MIKQFCEGDGAESKAETEQSASVCDETEK